MKISFVIPACNESKTIGRLLQSIHTNMKASDMPYEILVINNESKDNTADIAKENNATVIDVPGDIISQIRNTGVKQTDGDILVFLDGDVELTENWSNVFLSETLPLFEINMFTITGSMGKIPRNGNWIEKIWFKPGETRIPNGLSTAHMITSRIAFDSVNGFDENIRVSSDIDLTLRMKENGYTFVYNPNLAVINHGYANTVLSLFKRQFWAGKNTLFKINKKLAVLCLIHIIIFMGLLIARNTELLFTYIGFVLAFSVLLSKQRTKKISLPGMFLSSVVLYASTISFVNVIFGKPTVKGARSR